PSPTPRPPPCTQTKKKPPANITDSCVGFGKPPPPPQKKAILRKKHIPVRAARKCPLSGSGLQKDRVIPIVNRLVFLSWGELASLFRAHCPIPAASLQTCPWKTPSTPIPTSPTTPRIRTTGCLHTILMRSKRYLARC